MMIMYGRFVRESDDLKNADLRLSTGVYAEINSFIFMSWGPARVGSDSLGKVVVC